MHAVIRLTGLLLLLMPAFGAPAHAAFGDPSLSNGGAPAWSPPPARTERRSSKAAEKPEQPPPADPARGAFVVSGQLLGGSMGFGFNLEARIDRWIVGAGVAKAYLGGGDDVEGEGRGLNTPISVRYLIVSDARRRHGADFGVGYSPMWEQDYSVIYVSAGYRAELDHFYLRGGLDLIGITGKSVPPIPFLPLPSLAVGARF